MFQHHQSSSYQNNLTNRRKNLERIDCIFLKLSNYITVLIVIIWRKMYTPYAGIVSTSRKLMQLSYFDWNTYMYINLDFKNNIKFTMLLL